MPHSVSPGHASISFELLSDSIRESSQIGAQIFLSSATPILKVDNLSDADKNVLRQALFENQVVVIRNQTGIDPAELPKLAKVFDPHASNTHSAGVKAVSDPKNILAAYKAGRIPRAPQVGIIGSGTFKDYEGIPELEVVHLDHTLFHEQPLGLEEIEQGYTRPYRWHMDAPLYERYPGEATILHCIKMPKLPDQKLKFPDGKEKKIAAGATAFFSGARLFELLTPDEQEFAMNTTVTYAPQAYEYIRNCKCTDDGLTIPTMGRETSLDKLTEWTWDKVAEYPMVWPNPLEPSRRHLQFHGCCAYKLTTKNPTTGSIDVVDDVAEVRRICYGLQQRIWQAENIYAHRWEAGDLVIFHNKGVMHSITGQLAQYKEDEDKKRLLWQCTMGSTEAPKAFRP